VRIKVRIKVKTLIVFLGLLCSLVMVTRAEGSGKIVLLWPDGGSGFALDFKHHQVELNGGRITEVSQPFLQIFPADPQKSTGASMLILPGGGYSILAYQHEGVQVAEFFAKQGIACFVVGYRVTKLHRDNVYQFPGPLLDVRQAMRYVKSHSKKLRIDPKKVGVLGFSAGGHLAGMCATRFEDQLKGDSSSKGDVRPAFGALIYPVVSMIQLNTHKGSRSGLFGANPSKAEMRAASAELRVKKGGPPLFLVHNQFDVVTSQNTLLLALAATKARVPCEFHLYPAGAHGFGMGRPNDTEMSQPAMVWPEALVRFINRLK